uniref:Tetratricopeptide repeat protein n=1 Tax=viral metagenome TaxID=1070528 RepID=A0A6C0LI12_9ZZZZ
MNTESNDTNSQNIHSDLESIVERLKNASDTHPNLCNLWANYLFLKRSAYDNALRQANAMLDTLIDSEDPDHNMLIALFAVSTMMTPSNR